MSLTVAALAPVVAVELEPVSRSAGKLSRAAGGELEQIQLFLGHISVANDGAIPWLHATDCFCGKRQNRNRACVLSPGSRRVADDPPDATPFPR